MNAHEREAVLLLHGLWMNRHVMRFLQAALDRAGFAPRSLGYRSMRGTLAEHCERVANAIAALASARVHLIGHSLGGVVALAFLARHAADSPLRLRLGRAVLLGAPVAGSDAAAGFAQHAGGRLLMGASRALWRDSGAPRVPPGREVGAIAGTVRFGLGPLFVNLDGANDGVVRVDETRLAGLADHIELPVSHTGMLVSSAVARQCIAFLRQGRFAR